MMIVKSEMHLNQMTLSQLAKSANASGDKARQNAAEAVRHAIDAGEALTAAKKKVRHGEWAGWLELHWDYSHAWANRLMRLAVNSKKNELSRSARSVSEAILIADGKPLDNACRFDASEFIIEKQTTASIKRKVHKTLESLFAAFPESMHDDVRRMVVEECESVCVQP